MQTESRGGAWEFFSRECIPQNQKVREPLAIWATIAEQQTYLPVQPDEVGLYTRDLVGDGGLLEDPPLVYPKPENEVSCHGYRLRSGL